MAEKISNETIFTELMEVSKTVAGIAPIVADLKKAVITGNGVPSLLQRVKTIEDCHASDAALKQARKETKEKWGARTWAVVITGITVILGNSAGLIILLIRFGTIH